MVLAPLIGTALLVAVATGPIDDPMGLTHWTPREKSAATQPLVRSATDCIAHAVFADPRYHANDSAELGNLIVDSMPSCVASVRAMIDAYDQYYGDGSGEAFSWDLIWTYYRSWSWKPERKPPRHNRRRTHKYICGARSRLQSQVVHNHKWRHADQCDGGGPMTSMTRILVGSTSTTLFSTMVYL